MGGRGGAPCSNFFDPLYLNVLDSLLLVYFYRLMYITQCSIIERYFTLCLHLTSEVALHDWPFTKNKVTCPETEANN